MGHFTAPKSEEDKKKLTPSRSSSSTDSLISGAASPVNTTSSSPRLLPSASSGIDTKGRLVKQQGYLELVTTVEEADQVLSSKKQQYYFELLGGYLNWYANDIVARTGQVIYFAPFGFDDTQ